MAVLHFHNTDFQVLQDPIDAKVALHEVVEISSDEDEDDDVMGDMSDGQPESSQRPDCLPPITKRAVSIDSNDDNNSLADVDLLQQFLEPPRLKRQKTVHLYNPNGAGTHFNGSSPNEYPMYHAPQSEKHDYSTHTKMADTNIDGFNDDGDRTTLALRPVTCINSIGTSIDREQFMQAHTRIQPIDIDARKGKARLATPPYYDDLKLETRMYCGPGYETFPIALGTSSEHQDICDQWDRVQRKRVARQTLREARRLEFAQYINDTSDASSDEEDLMDVAGSIAAQVECFLQIREILPDIQREFALEKIRYQTQTIRRDSDDEIQILPSAADVVSHILESSDYPKQEKQYQDREPADDGTGITIEWQKGDEQSKTYQRDAVCLLAGQFNHIPTHFIFKVVQEKKSLLESYSHIHHLELNYDGLPVKERPYRRSQNPRRSLEKKYINKDVALRSKVQWDNLVNELQAAKQRIQRDVFRKARESEEAAREQANLDKHKAAGTIVECQCCFDEEIPINRAVMCEDETTHWFCFACVLGLAENQVGSMKHEMNCMHESGCKAKLSSMGIRLSVPMKLFDKLAFYQQQSEIAAACIEGLEQCPFCDFKAICDPIEVSSVFQCQYPDCKRVSCRKCHEDTHLPKTCEEFKSDRRLSARHQIEEARSEAMMRTCPKCKVKIIKDIGCNKMRCVKCGCVMCYICKTDISNRKDGGYGHFNDTGAKCVLYDKDFDRHEAEANEAEKSAIEKVRSENTDIDEKLLQIETGTQQKKPIPKRNGVGPRLGRPLFIPQPPLPPIAAELLDVQMDFARRRLQVQQEYQRFMGRRREFQDLRLGHNQELPGNQPQVMDDEVQTRVGGLLEQEQQQQYHQDEMRAHRQNVWLPNLPAPSQLGAMGNYPVQARTVGGPVGPVVENLTLRDPAPLPDMMERNVRTGLGPLPRPAHENPQVQDGPKVREPNYGTALPLLPLHDVGPLGLRPPGQHDLVPGLYDADRGFLENLFAPLNDLNVQTGVARGFAEEQRLRNHINAWDPFNGLGQGLRPDQINFNQFEARPAYNDYVPMDAGMYNLPF